MANSTASVIESFGNVVIGGNFVGSLTRHVMESFAYNAGIALHVRVLAGRDRGVGRDPAGDLPVGSAVDRP